MMKKLVLVLTCLISLAGIASAQVSKVTGTVTFADDNTPVIGASVFVKGTTVGTITDIDGKYVITNVPASAKVLTFSFIGMRTEEMPIKPEVNVQMSAGTETLEEAVVTIAYGAAKKSSLTGAVASVDAEKIENRITTDVTSALEGSVAGVQVNSTYGAPGESPTIQIRGIGTINGDATPLYVVDGVPYDGDSADLNPADIESVSVLKDAASAALYGNRASNGVILITTKQGSPGKIQMRVDIKQGIYTQGQGNYDTISPDQWMEVEWQAIRNRFKSKGDDYTTAANKTTSAFVDSYAKLNIYNVPNDQLFDSNGKLNPAAKIRPQYLDDLDWYKEAFRVGWRQEYNIRASAGTEKSDFYFSIGYLNEQGYVLNADYSRLTGRAVINTKPFKWMKAGVNINGSYQNTNHTNGNENDGSTEYTNYFAVCRQMAPIYPVHIHNPETGDYALDRNGNKQYSTGFYTDEFGNSNPTRNQYEDRNILWENTVNTNTTRKVILGATAFVDLYFLKNFTFTVKGNLNLRSTINRKYYSSEIGSYKGTGAASRTDQTYKKVTLQEQLRWTRQFGSHSVNLLVAHESYSYDRNYYYGYKDTEITPGKDDFLNFTQMVKLYDYDQQYRTESFLGRARYNYRDKYNLEASFRRDGSSRFSQYARWGNFWSIGANWMISHEDFMRNVDWINSLKLRADYGEVGNDSGASYYSSLDLYAIDQNYNEAAYYYSQIANYDLQWETSQSWGVGIEARMFGKWNLNIEYFDKRNKDLLFDVYNPLSAGATKNGAAESVTTKNIGTISNRGIEIETDVDIIKNRRWKWNVGANGTYLKNEVLSLPDGYTKGITTYSGRQRIQVGQPLHQWYVYEWGGIDQTDGRSVYVANMDSYCITENDSAFGKVLYGNPKYNEDGSIANLFPKTYRIINNKPYTVSYTYAKRTSGISSHPKFFGSFSSSLSWKQFTLSALFTYSLGGYVFDTVYKTLMTSSYTSMHNYHQDILTRSWIGVPVGVDKESPDRLSTEAAPKVNAYYASTDNATSSRWLISANYFIVKNVKLSYNFPKKVVKNWGLRGITASVTGENLATISARKGFNPQQTRSGIHSNVLVAPRIITFDLSIKF